MLPSTYQKRIEESTITLQDGEEIKTWKGFSKYLFTSYGRIWSYNKNEWKKLRGNNNDPYLRTDLTDDEGSVHTFTAHLIICSVFHGSKPFPKATVHHKDHNTHNNRADNLEWKPMSGHFDEHHREKQIEAQAKRPVICIESGLYFNSQAEAARFYNIRQSGVYNSCIKGHGTGSDKLHFRYATEEEIKQHS